MSAKNRLRSSDDCVLIVDDAVASQFEAIKHMIDDACSETIHLPNITGATMAKVIEYCNKHVDAGDNTDENAASSLKDWDSDFIRVDQETIFDLLLAAYFLNIKSLRDLTCTAVAAMIEGKSPEELRRVFKIKNDFTPEEEERVRRENAWVFE